MMVPGQRNQGCIYIITDFESKSAINLSEMPKICAPKDQHFGRFGTSVEVDETAFQDHVAIIVGSPRVGTETVEYGGCFSTYLVDSEMLVQDLGSLCTNSDEEANMGSTLKILKENVLLTSGIHAKSSTNIRQGKSMST